MPYYKTDFIICNSISFREQGIDELHLQLLYTDVALFLLSWYTSVIAVVISILF